MIYVTDTHPFVFYALGITRKLGKAALKAFIRAEKRQDTILIPSICFFELALLLESGKIRSSRPLTEWKEHVETAGTFIVESLSWADIAEAHALSLLIDPFDRLIVGTANRLGCPLITRESRITESRTVPIVWA